MDGTRLTDEQRVAIERREVSVALSAGAGCGKTFVLTERFLSYLAPGSQVSLGELVAITFTERTAREMRDRIRRRCQERLAEATTDAEADHWLAISRELESARISTIHAFCASLLRAHAVEAGLDPRFRTLDQTQSETLLAETLDDALRKLLARRDEAVMDLAVRFGLSELKKMLRHLLWQREKIDFAQWTTRTADDVLDAWAAFHRDVVRPQTLRDLAEGETATALLRVLGDNVPDNPVMQLRRAYLLEHLPALPSSSHPQAELVELKEHARVQGGGTRKAWRDEEAYDQVKDLLTDLRGDLDKAAHGLKFEREPVRGAAQAGLQLLAVTQAVAEEYAQRKRAAGVLDFDDLLIRARDLLADERHASLRQSLGRQIHALLVDEFQDTDPLQVELVKALCGNEAGGGEQRGGLRGGGLRGGKLFFVGDYKQSIYRFRRADPRVFRQLQEEMPAAGRLPLTLNFRSQPPILAFVNALFCEELGPAYEPLRAYRLQVTAAPAVEFLWVAAQSPDESMPDQRRREAQWLARRLRQLFDEGALIVSHSKAAANDRRNTAQESRAVRPGDVAILFRALSDVQFYEEALREHGIDYYLVGGHAFYAQQEIYDLLNLLRAIAHADDQISLVGALRSSFFCLSDETLYWLAKHAQGVGGGLLAEAPSQVEADQAERVAFAAATLQRLRAGKDRLPIAALVEDVLRSTGYDAVLLAEFMGERKLANLHKLIDQARTFDRSGILSLEDFITQLSEFVAKQPDEPLAATMPEKADVVRLMTIHQAKGLEFPVVFVPDLKRPTNGVPPPAAFHAELGPLVRSAEEDRRQHVLTGYDFLHRLEEGEDRAELMRLFYVAATRAADYLVLSSSVSEVGDAGSPWLRLLSQRFDVHTGECQAKLPSEWERPRVRVTTSVPPAADAPRRARRPNLDAAVAQAVEMSAAPAALPATIEPIAPEVGARREFSFSRLHGTLHVAPDSTADVDEPGESATAGRSSIDARSLGTLVHAVLEEIPLRGTGAAAAVDIAQVVARHAAGHIADASHRAAAQELAADMVRRFLRSPLAAELAAAQEVHRELEFLLAWPPDRPAAGGVYLRGYIDCLFHDAQGRWQLLDYKTNDIRRGGVKQTAANYEMQMLVYGLAAEQALGTPVERLVLYFLRPGMAQPLELDAAARRRAVTLVNQAIAAYVRQASGCATTEIVATASERPGAEAPPRDDSPRDEAIRKGPPPGHFRKKLQNLLPGFFDRKNE